MDIHSSTDLGEAFLAHYGVKGMHWGIRNDKENHQDSSTPKRMAGFKTDKATFKANLPSLKHPINRIRYVHNQRTTAGKAATYGIMAAFGSISFIHAMRSDNSMIMDGYNFIRNRFSGFSVPTLGDERVRTSDLRRQYNDQYRHLFD